MTDALRIAEEALRKIAWSRQPGGKMNAECVVMLESIAMQALDELSRSTAGDAEPKVYADELSDERIDKIADLVVRGMENGLQGFLKVWGWQQFARELLKVVKAGTAGDEARDAERMEGLRQNMHWDGNGYWLPDLCIKSRGWGEEFTTEPTPEEFRAAIDAAIAASRAASIGGGREG